MGGGKKEYVVVVANCFWKKSVNDDDGKGEGKRWDAIVFNNIHILINE